MSTLKNISQTFNRLRAAMRPRAKAKEIRHKVEILAEIKQRTDSLRQQDILNWRQAWQRAIDIDYPLREKLLLIYQDVMIDNHLSGAIANRKNAVLATDFVICNSTGEIDREMTRFFEESWFRGVDTGDGISGGFCSLALDSIFWGHSLMEIYVDKETGLFSDIELVPRKYVIPEFNMYVTDTIYLGSLQGIRYDEDPTEAWTISIGHPRSLGLLLKLCPEVLSKKNVKLFWDEFAEIFGMPMRIGRTSVTDPAEREKMEEMLDQMGSKAWGLFNEATEIELVETKNTDAWQIYDKRIERADKEIAKLVLGQTMTMDDGSSRSQAEVHERVAERLYLADLTFLKDQINKKLIPKMVRHGYSLEGFSFAWDIPEQVTNQDLTNMRFVLENFEVDESEMLKLIQKKFRLPVTAIKEADKDILPSSDPVTAKLKKTGNFPKQSSKPHTALLNPYAQMHQELRQIYGRSHQQEHSVDRFDDLQAEFLRMAKALHDGTISVGQLYTELYLKIGLLLQEGLFKGWNDPKGIDYDSIDNIRKSVMQYNLHAFAGAKNIIELQEINRLLLDEQGRPKPFSAFQKDVLEIHQTYNVRYLRTEYNGALASGQSASAWLAAQESKEDFPGWIYRTAGDERVRASHRPLDGMVLLLDDPMTDQVWPPNGYGCRCDSEPTDVDPVSSSEAATRIAQADILPYFQRNVGKENEVFPLTHPYFSQANLKNDLRAVEDYGMRSIEKIMNDPSKLPVIGAFKEDVKTIKDPSGLLVQTFNSRDADIIANADELFSISETERVYIRYYDDRPRKSIVEDMRAVSTGEVLEQDRTGILLHRKT